MKSGAWTGIRKWLLIVPNEQNSSAKAHLLRRRKKSTAEPMADTHATNGHHPVSPRSTPAISVRADGSKGISDHGALISVCIRCRYATQMGARHLVRM